MYESHHFLLLFFNLLLILLHYFVQMFSPFLFIFLKEQRLNLLQIWQRCNNVSSWSPFLSDLLSTIHILYSGPPGHWNEIRTCLVFFGSFMKSGPVSQIISGVTFAKSIPGSLEALEQGSVSTIERKNGAKIQKNTYIWPILDHCSQTVSQGCCFWGKFLGLPVKKPKVGWIEEATRGSIISTRNRRDFRW